MSRLLLDEDQGGLSKRGIRALGFDAPCQCGHEDGLHEVSGRCAVLGCECTKFNSPSPASNQSSRCGNAGGQAPSAERGPPATTADGAQLLDLSKVRKTHRIPISGAEPEDVHYVYSQVECIYDLAISALMGRLENLRENLPIGEINFEDIYAGLRDLRNDTLGRLERAAEVQ